MSVTLKSSSGNTYENLSVSYRDYNALGNIQSYTPNYVCCKNVDGTKTIVWVRPYTLTLITDNHGKVYRSGSSLPGVTRDKGYLSNGSTIYYGDRLRIELSTNTEYYSNITITGRWKGGEDDSSYSETFTEKVVTDQYRYDLDDPAAPLYTYGSYHPLIVYDDMSVTIARNKKDRVWWSGKATYTFVSGGGGELDSAWPKYPLPNSTIKKLSGYSLHYTTTEAFEFKNFGRNTTVEHKNYHTSAGRTFSITRGNDDTYVHMETGATAGTRQIVLTEIICYY